MIYEASGQAKAWKDQEQMVKEGVKEAEMMKVQEWHKVQQINTTMAEQWKQQQNSEVMTMTDAHDPLMDEYTFPNQIQINKRMWRAHSIRNTVWSENLGSPLSPSSPKHTRPPAL